MVSEASENRERRGEEARQAFLAEFPSVAIEEHIDLGRGEEEGRIFGVAVDGMVGYPAFQFGPDGAPKQSVAAVIAALRHRGLSGWGLALWWVTPHESLAARPVDLLDHHSTAVVRAAGSQDDSAP